MPLTHNVYLVKGGEGSLDQVLAYLESSGIDTHGNPDLYIYTYRQLGVDEARALSARASLKAVGARRIFVVAATQMTTEAQNALLKTIEEPRGDAFFVFIVPSPDTLLATVRSRAHVLEIGGAGEASAIDSKKFLLAAVADRLKMLQSLIEKDENDERDTAAIVAFLSSLERYLAQHAGAKKDALESVYRARKYILDKGALVKPLLEQVALLVPRV